MTPLTETNPHPPDVESIDNPACRYCGHPFTPTKRTRSWQRFGSAFCQKTYWVVTYQEARKLVIAQENANG